MQFGNVRLKWLYACVIVVNKFSGFVGSFMLGPVLKFREIHF